MKEFLIASLLLALLPQLSFSAEEITVRILGRLADPGEKKIPKGTGIVELIYQSGGIATGGCPACCKIMEITEKGRRQIEVDAYKIVMENKKDIQLRDNQTVWIIEHLLGHLDWKDVQKFNEMLPAYLKNQKSIQSEVSTPFAPLTPCHTSPFCERMNFPIQIIKVKSRSTGKEYHIAFPQADTDMATDGLFILVSKEKEEIQLHMASGDEYPLGPHQGAQLRAKRENEKNQRNDLVAASVDLSTPADSRSCCRFAYHDAMDESEHADAIERISVEEFRAQGGRLEDLRHI